MEACMSRLNIRVSAQVKDQAEALFESLGMNMSTAINIFLAQSVREQAIPFAITANQTKTRSAFSLDEITQVFTNAVATERSENAAKGFPVAEYDREKNQAYLKYPNGDQEVIDE
jgi:DNA-damage-inducible protein J